MNGRSLVKDLLWITTSGNTKGAGVNSCARVWPLWPVKSGEAEEERGVAVARRVEVRRVAAEDPRHRAPDGHRRVVLTNRAQRPVVLGAVSVATEELHHTTTLEALVAVPQMAIPIRHCGVSSPTRRFIRPGIRVEYSMFEHFVKYL